MSPFLWGVYLTLLVGLNAFTIWNCVDMWRALRRMNEDLERRSGARFALEDDMDSNGRQGG